MGMMTQAVLLFIVGLVFLIKGGDWFVDGATGIAQKFKMPEILIGATVVSIGTTLPEVMVSATAAVSGHSQIAYGNAIGSIICNTSLILAITAAFSPQKVERKSLVMPVIFFFVASSFYAGVAYIQGRFTRITGVMLLIIFVVYMGVLIKQARGEMNGASSPDGNSSSAESEESTGKKSLVKDVVLLIIGAALIAVGADLLVDNGTIIASALGVPESVIALTVVALGTSLPELVTAVTSIMKGHGALSLGNVIGANIFNIVLVSGLASTLSPFTIPADKTIMGINSSLVLDVPLMIAVMMIATIPTLIKGKISRWQGILLLCIYFGFCALQFAI